MAKLILLFVIALTTQAASAGSYSAKERFADALDQLHKNLHKASSNRGFMDAEPLKQAHFLIQAGVRGASFQLQSLGRIYSEYPDKNVRRFAERIEKRAKAVEDGLGKYDQYKHINKMEKASKASKKLMAEVFEQEWLTEKGDSPLIKGFEEELDKQDWLSANEDRTFVLDVLRDQLKKVDKKEYDMTLLEDGVHEMRRQVRWFTMYALALEGIIQKSDRGEYGCTQKRIYFREYIDPKYADLPPATHGENVCILSACLYDELVGAVGAFGKVKDEAEPIMDEGDDRLPKHLVDEAKIFYKNLNESKILSLLANEVKACK